MFGNFSLFKTPLLGLSSVPPSFVSFFVLYIFSYLHLKTMGCFSGCLMSSAGIQKLFCGIYLAFKCSFDEFVGEKMFSLSYSSAILAPPSSVLFLAALGLRGFAQAFSSCSKQGLLFVVVHGLLTVVAFLAAEHGLSSLGAQA